MSEFQAFGLEQFMSAWEQTVEYNLTESGVHPVVLRELLEMGGRDAGEFLDTDLNYPMVNGTTRLRENIALLYEGAGADDVLVTVGAAEANYDAIDALLEPGDEIAVMRPNYMQVWGLAKNRGLQVATFSLLEDQGWALDVDGLRAAVNPRTRLIAVCNPNNPTGRILHESEMDEVVAVADSVGAWLLADEVYRGAERERREETPSFFGRYDKVVAIGSMSKAYGMPGLRLGWAVAPKPALQAMWRRHEYTTISTTKLANELGALALSPEVRPRLIERTRAYLRKGFPVLEGWMRAHGNTFSMTPPEAAAIAFIRYHLDVNSSDLVDRIRAQKSVLLVPGDHFGFDHYLRISYGLPEQYLKAALERVHDLLLELGG